MRMFGKEVFFLCLKGMMVEGKHILQPFQHHSYFIMNKTNMKKEETFDSKVMLRI